MSSVVLFLCHHRSWSELPKRDAPRFSGEVAAKIAVSDWIADVIRHHDGCLIRFDFFC